jgi:hypothetical protein
MYSPTPASVAEAIAEEQMIEKRPQKRARLNMDT